MATPITKPIAAPERSTVRRPSAASASAAFTATASSTRTPRYGMLLSIADHSTSSAQYMNPPQTSGTVMLSSTPMGSVSTTPPTAAVAMHTINTFNEGNDGSTQRPTTKLPRLPATMKAKNPDQVFPAFHATRGPPSASPATLASPSPSAMMAHTAPTTSIRRPKRRISTRTETGYAT